MSDRKPRISLHPGQDYISIGFEGTNDTLLKMPSRPEGWGDHAVAVEWVAAINVALDLAGAREIDCPDCGSPYDENCTDCDVPAGWVSLAARLAEVEDERNELRRKLNSTLRQEADLSRDLGNALDDLAEVEAENARLRELALVEAEGQHDEMLGATGLAAERDRLAQELEDERAIKNQALGHLRDVTGSAGYVDRANAMGEALSFLARFPREGEGEV